MSSRRTQFDCLVLKLQIKFKHCKRKFIIVSIHIRPLNLAKTTEIDAIIAIENGTCFVWVYGNLLQDGVIINKQVCKRPKSSISNKMPNCLGLVKQNMDHDEIIGFNNNVLLLLQ